MLDLYLLIEASGKHSVDLKKFLSEPNSLLKYTVFFTLLFNTLIP